MTCAQRDAMEKGLCLAGRWLIAIIAELNNRRGFPSARPSCVCCCSPHKDANCHASSHPRVSSRSEIHANLMPITTP